MNKDTYTLQITLIPRFRNNLKEHSYKKEQNVARDRSLYNTLIKYNKIFDRKKRSLLDCWCEVNGYMEENIKELIGETAQISTYSIIGYRYIGYYMIVELNALESHSIDIWAK